MVYPNDAVDATVGQNGRNPIICSQPSQVSTAFGSCPLVNSHKGNLTILMAVFKNYVTLPEGIGIYKNTFIVDFFH